MNTYKVDKPPLGRRIGWKVLPPTRQHNAYSELPQWAKDEIIVACEVRLGFIDRLRILFWGKLRVDNRVYTEHLPGRVETVTSVGTE